MSDLVAAMTAANPRSSKDVRPNSRRGKRGVLIHLEATEHHELKRISFALDRSIQSLGEEAFDAVVKKYRDKANSALAR